MAQGQVPFETVDVEIPVLGHDPSDPESPQADMCASMGV